VRDRDLTRRGMSAADGNEGFEFGFFDGRWRNEERAVALDDLRKKILVDRVDVVDARAETVSVTRSRGRTVVAQIDDCG
jgi:hypothetical protein